MGEHAFIPTRRSDPARESAQRRAGPRRLLARSCAVRRPRLGTATMGQSRPRNNEVTLQVWYRIDSLVSGPVSCCCCFRSFFTSACYVFWSWCCAGDIQHADFSLAGSAADQLAHISTCCCNGPLTVHKHWESWPRCDATWWSGRLCAAGGPAVDRR